MLTRRPHNPDDGEYKKPYRLPKTTNDEWKSPTESLDQVEARDGHGHIDCTED